MKLVSLLLILLISSFSCKTKEEWKSRTIYQIITDRFARTQDTGECDLYKYCGGNYQGIIDKLDYIKGMGFDAIWLSPIVENFEDSYHGYHYTNFYKLNPHFGTEDDFKALVEACHKKDIWILLDVQANDVAPVGTNYENIVPFNSSEHYHDWCEIVDWNNQWQIENCRLVGLPDLKQENDYVAETLYNWINDLVKKYDVDGIRISLAMEVPKWFWDKFTKSAGVFQTGEIFNGNPSYVADYQNHMDSVLNYPLYYTLRTAFIQSFKRLEEYWLNFRSIFLYPEYNTIFIENNDVERFLHESNDKMQYINAAIFIFLWEGIPIFYNGGEQYFEGGADPYNREPLWDNYDTSSELYQLLGKINEFRKNVKIWNFKIVQRLVDDNFYAFTRGNVLACFANKGSIERTILNHDFKNGDKLCNVLDSSDCVTVSGNGISISMKNYPKVYVKQ